MDPARAAVDVVIATYARPDALRVAIESVALQQHPHWKLLVIGDACAPETGTVVDSFDDDRIRYVNLPERCGEQAIPNSIGLALAQAAYVAFLNHDDVWMPDHLSTALAALARDGKSFFIGRCAIADPGSDPESGAARPVFREKWRPARGGAWAAYDAPPWSFEPCSAWVVDRELAQRVGPWRPARTLDRTPLEDWLLRSLRSGARVAFGERVTLLKFNTQHADSGAPRYAAQSPEHAWISRLLAEPASRSLRELVEADLRRAGAARPPGRKSRPAHTTGGPLGRALFRALGVDLYALTSRALRRERGHELESLSRKRTGEALPETPDVDALLRAARRALEASCDPASRSPSR